MLKAIIDLGTNTFNLIIAKVKSDGFELIYSEKDGVALGMGGINESVIAKDALQRAQDAILNFKTIIDHHQVETVKAFGTSAIRDANNAHELINFIQNVAGISVEVINGKREAELIFSGVSRTHELISSGMIMDIGGGSTEFVAYKNHNIVVLVSLNIGVSRIYQQIELSDPLTQDQVLTIEKFLENESKEFFKGRNETEFIGASGSFETFYELIEKKNFPECQVALELNIPKLKSSLKEIMFSSMKDRDSNTWIIPIRKKMAPIAAVKTNWVLSKLPIDKLYVSPFSLKEGALFEL
jgi:exopolyphosphatase/guanosine-5'-triphosphate,3'-diphosphate pyrophosphatase